MAGEHHPIDGEIEDRPTARILCTVKDESFRVFDPSKIRFCPICGRSLPTEGSDVQTDIIEELPDDIGVVT